MNSIFGFGIDILGYDFGLGSFVILVILVIAAIFGIRKVTSNSSGVENYGGVTPSDDEALDNDEPFEYSGSPFPNFESEDNTVTEYTDSGVPYEDELELADEDEDEYADDDDDDNVYSDEEMEAAEDEQYAPDGNSGEPLEETSDEVTEAEAEAEAEEVETFEGEAPEIAPTAEPTETEEVADNSDVIGLPALPTEEATEEASADVQDGTETEGEDVEYAEVGSGETLEPMSTIADASSDSGTVDTSSTTESNDDSGTTVE